MNNQFERGDILILELINTDEILEGEYVDGFKDRLTLRNITSYKTNNVIRGPYSYYKTDIFSVKVLNKANTHRDIVGSCNTINSHQTDVILISKLEYDRLKLMSQNYIYLSTLDSRYYDAMKYVKDCETIGLAGITTSYETTAQLNLLSISTWDQVYILDFHTLNAQVFPTELKEILECEHIKKVLHDSRLFVKILNKCFNVRLTNIFDTKVADITVRKQMGEAPKYSKNLSECLVYYFNFPATFIAFQQEKLDKWKQRPLSDLQKLQAAQMATFLVTLKNYLEHTLLQDFYKTVDAYSKSLQDCSMKEVSTKLVDNKLCDILNNIKLI